ncbi:putative ISXo8 transposase [Actinoplanes cyaneus]|uniref:ISXo8 transposase n=1 Tax=Actinoplanes cyaneus TaxID=52696 RepID=A0A919IG88_9ACTN|nr:DDE superfamily endonuclease [Actinoplanes cyaneus]GID64968.1 putative ISXo8 transposase [Actinoplanes cyaneus]
MAASMRSATIDAASGQSFVEEVFRPLPRADQRHWARTYLRGLLSAPHRASPGQLAAAQSLPAATAHRLHQFVNASTWAWEPVRQALARHICSRTTPSAWAVTELFIPRRGHSTVGVHTTVDGASGRKVRGQSVLGLFLCTEAGSFPVSWRLLLRDAWAEDRQRRLRARIPRDVTARPRWAHLMEFVGEVSRGRLPALPWILTLPLAPADVTGVLGALSRRRVDVVCETSPEQQVYAVKGPAGAMSVGALLNRERARSVPVFLSARGSLPVEPRRYQAMWWPGAPDGRGSARCALTNLGPRHAGRVLAGADECFRDAAARMSRQLGVDDFRGRSFPGWHHHMTMAAAAHAFQRLAD